VCKGDTVSLVAAGGDRYLWSPATGLATPGGNTTIAVPTSNTQYKVLIEEDRCGITDSLFVSVRVADKPTVVTTKSNDITCFLGEATLTTGGGSRYRWQPATGLSDPVSARPVVRVNTTTTYHVQVTTPDGCVVEDSITVNVLKGEGGFPVPDAFTPNGDGKNDCFGVRYWGDVQEFSLNLYNRWGELVFHADQPSQCWNGIYKGQRQPGDVYVYLIKAKTRCGEVMRKGTFVLMR
jgi:gliding motility-associated-like protein